MADIFIRRWSEGRHIGRQQPCDYRDRCWGDAFTKQGKTKDCWTLADIKKKKEKILLRVSDRESPCQHLNFEFLASITVR